MFNYTHKLNHEQQVLIATQRAAEWRTLERALRYVTEYNEYALDEIILYNIPLRDRLREIGIVAFVNELKNIYDNQQFADIIDKWSTKHADFKVADYDIQAYLTDQTFEVAGHPFDGFQDMKNLVGNDLGDVYIKEECELYPCFDSSDYKYENRFYQYYFFRPCPKKEDEKLEIPRSGSLDHSESLPMEQLPLVYYNGEGQHLLVITKRNKINKWFNAKFLRK